MKSDILNSLCDQGWALAKTECQAEMLDIAQHFGTPCPSREGSPLIDLLRPTPRHQAHKSSLSAIYGQGSFPLHIDTAHWRTPARYLLLRAEEAGTDSHPTVILDGNSLNFEQDEIEELSRGVFLVRTGQKSFLSTILSANIPFIRFDSGCMSPKSGSAHKALEVFRSKIEVAEVSKIEWSVGDTLIIDNWRCLHGRGKTSNPISCRRVLSRILALNP